MNCWMNMLYGIGETAIYSIVGILLMGLGFMLVKFFTPFSIKKEIEDDQNIALGVIIASIILGISIIVAAVIVSPSSIQRGGGPVTGVVVEAPKQ